MANNSHHDDYNLTGNPEGRSDRGAIIQTGLEHLVLKDFIHSSLLGIIDRNKPYYGYYYDELPQLMTSVRPEGGSFVQDYFSPENQGRMISAYETRLKKPEDELDLVEYCIAIFGAEPTVEEMQNLKREVIGRLEDLTIKIIEHERVQGEELNDMIANTKFLKRILNIFADESIESALDMLNTLKEEKQEEVSRIKARIASLATMDPQAFSN